MGRVRRRLLRVKSAASEFPTLPAALFLGGRKVGELRSAVQAAGGGFAGLAMLSLLHLTPGARLAFAAGAETTVQLEDEP
jgi:folate-binding Fe-S cluster repair protein YgfZ